MLELDAHHVGLTVADLDESIAFYRDVFGLSVVDRFDVGGEAFADAVDVDGASADFAHLDAGGVRLELVEYEPAGDERGTPALNQPGAGHVGLAVDDLGAFDEALPGDVTTLSRPRTTESGTSILFVRDPDGNLVEVLEA